MLQRVLNTASGFRRRDADGCDRDGRAPLSFAKALGGKNSRVNRLILGADGETVSGQSGQRPFWFLFAGQMKMKPFEVAAKSREPGAVTAPRGRRKVVPPKHFRKSAHRCIGITSAILIYEQLFIY